MSTPISPPFAAGDTVLYPHHGAGIVLDSGSRTVNDVKRDYLRIYLLSKGMTLHVPVDETDSVALTRISATEAVVRVQLTGASIRPVSAHLRPVVERLRNDGSPNRFMLNALLA